MTPRRMEARRRLAGGAVAVVASLAAVVGLPGGAAWALPLENITATPAPATAGAASTYTVAFEAQSAFTTGTAADFTLDATADGGNDTEFSSTGTYTITDCGPYPGTCNTPTWSDTTATTVTVTVTNPGPASGETVSLVDSAGESVNSDDYIEIMATAVTNPTVAGSYYLAVSTGGGDGPTDADYTVSAGVATQLGFCAASGGPPCPTSFSGTAGTAVDMAAYALDAFENATCIFPAADGGDSTDCTMGSVTVCLASSSATGVFAMEAGGPAVTTGAGVATTCTLAPPAGTSWLAYTTIATGSTHAIFTYTDDTAGSPKIYAADAAAGGLTESPGQTVTITAASPEYLVIACVTVVGGGSCSPAPPSAPAVPSGSANMELSATIEDQYGNPTTDPGHALTLSDAMSGGTFTGWNGAHCTGAAPANIAASSVDFCYGNATIDTYMLSATYSTLTCVTALLPAVTDCPLDIDVTGAAAGYVVLSGPSSASAQCAAAYSDGCGATITPTIGPFTAEVVNADGTPVAWSGTVDVTTTSEGPYSFSLAVGGACTSTSTLSSLTLTFSASATEQFCYADEEASEYLTGGVTDLEVGTITPGGSSPSLAAGSCPIEAPFSACGTASLTVTPEAVTAPNANGEGGGDVVFLSGVCPQPYAPPLVTANVTGAASPYASIPLCMELTDQFGNYGSPAVAPTGGVTEGLFPYPSSSGNEVSTTQYGASNFNVTIPAGDQYVTFYYGNSSPGFDSIAAYGAASELGTTVGGVACGSVCGGGFGPGGFNADITSGTSVSSPTVTVSPTTTGASATYTVAFETSSTGALKGGQSVIQLDGSVGASGTEFPVAASDYTLLLNGTSSTGTVSLTPTLSNSDATVAFTVPSGVNVPDGAEVTVTVADVVNPTTASTSDYLNVSTTSDTNPVATPEYTIGTGTTNDMVIVQGNDQSTGLGEAFGSPLEVKLTNSSGSPVAGTVVTFTAPSSGAGGTFQASGTNVENDTTNASGIAETSVFFANDIAGSFSVTAAASGFPTATFVLIDGAVTGISTLNSAVVASPSQVDANGVSYSVVTVTLENNFGVPVEGKTVTLASTSKTAAVTPSSAITGSSGQVTFEVTDTAAETVSFIATDTTDSETVNEQAIVVFTSAASLQITPTVLDFGDVEVNTESTPQSITFDNAGSETLSVTSAVPVGYDSTDFHVVGSTCTSPQLAPAASCSISVAFSPQGTCTRIAGIQLTDTAVPPQQTVVVYGIGTPSGEENPPAGCVAVPLPSVGSIGSVPQVVSHGYWLVASDGGVFTYGGAQYYGSTGGMHLKAPVVGMASTPDGHGYWLVASDGGVFTFGDAGFYGSTGALVLKAPVVGMAPTPDGHGYWLVASDGGVFSFGDAKFYGSTGALHLVAPVVGMAPTSNGHGYWLVASDGGIFTFGSAPFYGSASGHLGDGRIVSMTPTEDGQGYWLVDQSGNVVTFGDAPFLGSSHGTATAIVSAPQSAWGDVGSAVAGSYWVAGPSGNVTAFGDATFGGSYTGAALTAPVVGMSAVGG